ncbi:MAG TPA: SDR family oxidoreductase [Novosphingobium sp.]|nr:SDR family oxidoreductase [Novosphingobium sp.]
MSEELAGKVAIVTGGGTGIGRATAIAFAQAGAKVVVTGRTLETLDAVAAELQEIGGADAGLAIQCDVSRREEVVNVVGETVRKYGRVDVLMNNAHDFRDVYCSFMETTEEAIQRSFGSGFMGSFYFLQQCYPLLKEARGKVINMGSVAGVQGMENLFAYAAAKEAIRAMTRVLAREWGPDGINVNTICPHATDTPAMLESKEQLTAEVFDEMHSSCRALKRSGTCSEVATVALFLATQASSYITGHTLMVDGGFSIDAGR